MDAGLKGDDLVMDFQGGPLASMGMVPSSNNARRCGILFEGDGTHSAGTYFSWAGESSCIVSIADFRVLEDMPFTMEFPEFIAIRHDTAKYPGRNEMTAFAGAGRRSATTLLRRGMRCSFAEVVYMEPYFEDHMRGTATAQEVADTIAGMGGGIAWSPEIARPFEAIERCEGSGDALGLAFSGAADLLMGTLLCLGGSPLPNGNEREAIAAVVEYIDRNLDKPLRQEGMLGLAGMSAAKFKLDFKKVTGESMSSYIASRRMEKAKSLLSRGDSVGQVSREVGFELPANFATAFKRATGQTPTQWKRASRIQTLPPTDDTVRRIYRSDSSRDTPASTSATNSAEHPFEQ